jgi:hypothetical protein
MGISADIAGAVLNRVPVDKPRQTSVIDEVPDILVAAFIIGDVSPRNELIVDLSEREVVPLARVFRNNAIDQSDEGKTVLSEIDGLILNLRHLVHLQVI